MMDEMTALNACCRGCWILVASLGTVESLIDKALWMPDTKQDGVGKDGE
jgi:hypothetical protein